MGRCRRKEVKGRCRKGQGKAEDDRMGKVEKVQRNVREGRLKWEFMI